jgi:hypothetical protein
MKIDKNLNLVFPIERDAGKVYVHTVPLSLEMFERHALVIAKTFTLIYQQGLQAVAGPRVASILLKQQAKVLGVWEGDEGVEKSLLGEIRRSSNVIMHDHKTGWTAYPLETAAGLGYIDERDLSEAEGTAAFFICASAMHRRNVLPLILAAMNGWWESQTTSLTCTEWTASLQTSTVEESFGKMAGSSVPS